MDKLSAFFIAVLGAGFAILTAIVSHLRIKAQKAENASLKKSLDNQVKVVEEFEKRRDEVSEIQQKASEDEQSLLTATKGVQTSAEPIKKSIGIGNDIVDSFNSSGLQDNKGD